MFNAKKFAQFVYRQRLRSDLTQPKAAREIGISSSALMKIEKDTRPPTIEQFGRLCHWGKWEMNQFFNNNKNETEENEKQDDSRR